MILFLGERKVFDTGNSRGITIPSAIIKSVKEIKKVDVYFDDKKEEILLKVKKI